MNETFSRNLRIIRAEFGDTQQSLADKLGVARATVSNWEKSSSFPRMETLEKITKAYSCTVDDLITSRRHL